MHESQADHYRARLSEPDFLKPGEVVDGSYEIHSLLGSGAMCTVYKAKHVQLDRWAALKFLHPHLVTEGNNLQRFLREAQATSELKHPNIVAVYGLGRWSNQYYMALEYVEGESLEHLLRRQGRLSPEKALPLFLQICDGMSHSHEQHLIHRDLKPSNVMLTDSGITVKLLDFGIARFLSTPNKERQRLTETASAIGTPLYMSPEQCSGDKVDARSDIYSLGCLMYEVLSGRPPFTAGTPYAVMYKQATEDPESNFHIAGSVRAIIRKALEKKPDDRFQSVKELEEALLDPSKIPLAFGASKKRRWRSSELGFTSAIIVVLALGVNLLFAKLSGTAPPSSFTSSQDWKNHRKLLLEAVSDGGERAQLSDQMEQAMTSPNLRSRLESLARINDEAEDFYSVKILAAKTPANYNQIAQSELRWWTEQFARQQQHYRPDSSYWQMRVANCKLHTCLHSLDFRNALDYCHQLASLAHKADQPFYEAEAYGYEAEIHNTQTDINGYLQASLSLQKTRVKLEGGLPFSWCRTMLVAGRYENALRAINETIKLSPKITSYLSIRTEIGNKIRRIERATTNR